MKDAVALIGSYPPPYGGCSVHIERLREALASDYRMLVVDFYGRRSSDDAAGVHRFGPPGLANAVRAMRAVRRLRPAIAHFHVSAFGGFLVAGFPLVAALPRGTKAVVTIHGGTFVANFSRAHPFRRLALRALMRRFARIVAVSDDQRALLERLGVDPRKLAVIPAFLPPVARESPRVREVLASIAAGARRIVSSGVGVPYYGFHTIVDAVAARATATEEPEPVAVILCTYMTFDEAYLARLGARAIPGATVTIVRDLAPSEFAWLLERCDTYVRATDRDGDAVAIREALAYGKRTVASDCVVRPPEVTLFRTGDVASLTAALGAADARPGAPAPVGDGGPELAALRDVYAAIVA